MKETFKKGAKTFKDLVHTIDFTKKEVLLKYLILVVFLPMNAILYLMAGLFFLIERLFAHAFRFFIALQANLFKRKALTKQGYRKFYTILSVVLFIVFLPFILIYYLSMLVKYLAKQLMKKIVFAVDFSNYIPRENYLIFDDMSVQPGSMQMSGMMKDLSNTQAIGSAFEHIINQSDQMSNDRRKR